MSRPERWTSPWRPLPAVLGTIIFITACAILVLAGCKSRQERYRVLSFFFDGVPDPDREAVESTVTGEGGDGEEAAERRGSDHLPTVERRCGACHGVSKQNMLDRGLSGIGPSNVAQAWQACASCHRDPEQVAESAWVIRPDRWIHGPVAVGKCDSCHVGHRSEHPDLLRAEQQETICRSCHEELGGRDGSMAGLDCAACHDPHYATRSVDFSLRGGSGGNCAQCHMLDRERRPWLHAPVSTAECVFCHDAHGREGSVDHVRRPLRKACLGCHVEADLDPSEHPAGSSRECDECHDPHAAPSAADLFLRERIRPVLGDGPAFRSAGVVDEPAPAEAAPEAPP